MIKKLYKKIDAWMDYNPPGALSAKGWRLFNKEFQEKAPIRYWLRNTTRHVAIYPISRNISKIKSYISNRMVYKLHVVDTGLKPGYYEVDLRMYHANFNLLKDFVECELAWCRKSVDKPSAWYARLYFVRLFNRSRFRDPKLGIEYLEWASKLDDPSLPVYERADQQAITSREIHVLYDWWVNKRPNRKIIRPHKFKDQGLDLFGALDEDFNKDAEDYKKYRESMDEQSKQSKSWQEEDDEMLIRLVKIRRELWT